MRMFLLLLVCSTISTASFAGDRVCNNQRILTLDANKVMEQCRPYRAYKLKRPIVSRYDKKYKHIVETFDDRRAIRRCVQFVDF